MSAPLVSIAIASYRHERYIAQAIESVFAQTHRPLELIVVDDGSPDDSWAIIERMQKDAPIPMRIERQQNAGPAAAFQRGLDMADGEWFAILASDDFFHPDFVARSLSAANETAGGRVVVHSNAVLVEDDGTQLGTLETISALRPLDGNAFETMVEGHGRMHPCTMFVRRDLLLEAGGFDPTMLAEDCDLQLRLTRAAPFRYLPEASFSARHTPGSLGKRPWVWGDSIIRALAKHGDILGPRLPVLQAKAAENVAAACLEYGDTGQALAWSRKALALAPTPAVKAATTQRLLVRGARGLARRGLTGLFGRQRLVRWKRRLTRATA